MTRKRTPHWREVEADVMGLAGKAWCGPSRRSGVRHGWAGEARQVLVWPGSFGLGMAGMAKGAGEW